MQDILIAAIPPIVTAVLAAAGIWLRSRSRAQRTARGVAEARSRIAVITSMLDAYAGDPTRNHDEVKQQLLQDLDVAYRQMRGAEEAAQQEKTGGGVAALTRVVLLLDLPASTIAVKSALALYYLSLAWTLLWLAAAVMFGLIMALDTQGSFGSRLASSLGITVLALAIGLAPAVVLHLVARMSAGSGGRTVRRGPGDS